MIDFILNDQEIRTSQSPGTTVLDFVRYHKNLKGTKIGCREGDCGACTLLVGELAGDSVKYRTMTSCLMPLANASGKHIVTIEGINPPNRGLTPVQEAMVDESGTQCGFCTVGFVMSLTGFCIDETPKTPDLAISSVDGNICRCTGYKSIKRAVCRLSDLAANHDEGGGSLDGAISSNIIPDYFTAIPQRLQTLRPTKPMRSSTNLFVGGGTDVYVQKPEVMGEADGEHLFYDAELRGIRENGEMVEIGASATVTDLMVSPVMQAIFPDLYKHFKLVSSTPIRNMATLAGNFINASPIGDMTVWFLALNAKVEFTRYDSGESRNLPLKDLYLGYKQLARSEDEYIRSVRFRKPSGDFRFNFEKVSKRTYLDISTVNTAISLNVRSAPAPTWRPPPLDPQLPAQSAGVQTHYSIVEAHVAAGGVAPIPLYLKETSDFLSGKEVNGETLRQAFELIQAEISPISDVRGTEAYKRLLLRQLFTAHFFELFGLKCR
ncbi:MAG: FAD binding domain-containing protein [Pyrinomonadaceae bacterium]